MFLGTKEEITALLRHSGMTLLDLAARYDTTPGKITEELKRLGVPLPSMGQEATFDHIKSLLRLQEPFPAQDLLQFILPDGERKNQLEDPLSIYRSVHGDKVVDPYTQEEVTAVRIRFLDGDPNNTLVTNLEGVSHASWRSRYDHDIGLVSETYHFTAGDFEFKLTLSKKYDQLVGGAYNPEYVSELFSTWVGWPLSHYLKRLPEEAVIFPNPTPTRLAWWAWGQLMNYGWLKGMRALQVTDQSSQIKHGSILLYPDVLLAVAGSR